MKAAETEVFRYERKFFVTELSKQEVELVIKHHPACFSSIYHPRVINNIYFDTPGLNHYIDNVDGEKERLKARIRWYGSLFGPIEKPVLEFKIKKGLLGKKESFTLNSFTLDNNFNRDTIVNALKNGSVPKRILDYVSSLDPIILNCYHRKYFMSFDHNYRVTLDTDLKFFGIGYNSPLFINRSQDHQGLVVELKYGSENDQRSRDISQFFPFPLTKSSKYLQGVERVFF